VQVERRILPENLTLGLRLGLELCPIRQKKNLKNSLHHKAKIAIKLIFLNKSLSYKIKKN
jgi:hypothetical protein